MTTLFSRSIPESVAIRGPIRSLSALSGSAFRAWPVEFTRFRHLRTHLISERTLDVKCKQSPFGDQQIQGWGRLGFKCQRGLKLSALARPYPLPYGRGKILISIK